MAADIAPLYLQLVSMAPAIMLHCGGMCGPIVVALRIGEGGCAAGAGRLGLYQLGRALALGAAGAVCGLAGFAVSDAIELWGPWCILGLAALMLLAAVQQLVRLPFLRLDGDGGLATRLVRPLAGLAARHPRLGLLALGLVLGALPCGLVFWALGLAVASGSALHGAVLAAALVALSTLPLALAALVGGAALGSLRRRLAWLPTAALVLSALLLGAHGAAALEWIQHLHLGKTMLW